MNRIAKEVTRLTCSAALMLGLACSAGPALGWGDEGHQAVALVAYDHLTDAAKAKITELLAADTQPFQMRDGRMTNDSFATQATWADYYRESDGRNGAAYQKTHLWHFADIEINGGTLDDACFNYPALPEGVPASDGTPDDCVVDKINQFAAELASGSTSKAEKLLALKFLVHFIGDVHQPLHASDDHDAGGNGKNVTATGFKAGKLHHYWDTEFVLQIGATPDEIAATLNRRITRAQIAQWSSSDPKTWANESFALSSRVGYGELPSPGPARSGGGVSYHLPQEYVDDATGIAATQLSKAGIRLAATLNAALR